MLRSAFWAALVGGAVFLSLMLIGSYLALGMAADGWKTFSHLVFWDARVFGPAVLAVGATIATFVALTRGASEDSVQRSDGSNPWKTLLLVVFALAAVRTVWMDFVLPPAQCGQTLYSFTFFVLWPSAVGVLASLRNDFLALREGRPHSLNPHFLRLAIGGTGLAALLIQVVGWVA